MARRRKNEGMFTVFIALPWWVSVAAGLLAFILFYWVVPSHLEKNLVLNSLAPMAKAFAWICSVFFLITGCVAATRAKSQRPGGHADGRRPVQREAKRTQPVSPPLSTLGAEWGRTIGGTAKAVPSQKPVYNWSLESLRQLEWKRFELLCARYYDAAGFQTQTIKAGPDGGIDVKLFKIDPDKPIAIVQCKAWNSSQIGVAPVRELLGVMASEKVVRGIFITTSSFTKDASSFAASNPIQLLDGQAFVDKIKALPSDSQAMLLAFAFEGDYTTPTCASCGIKMAQRESKRGSFWGCLNFPRCRNKFAIRG